MELAGSGTPSVGTEVRGIQFVGLEAQEIQSAEIAVPGSQCAGFGIPSGEIEIQSVEVGIPLAVHSYSCPGAGCC